MIQSNFERRDNIQYKNLLIPKNFQHIRFLNKLELIVTIFKELIQIPFD